MSGNNSGKGGEGLVCSPRKEPGSDPFPHRPTTRRVFFSTGFQRLLQKSKDIASSLHRDFGTSFLHRRKSESRELETPSPPTSAPPVSGHRRLQPFTIRPSIASILRRRTQTTDKLISILRQHFSVQISFHPSELLQFRFAVRFYRRSIDPSNRSFPRPNQLPRLCFTGFPSQRTAIFDSQRGEMSINICTELKWSGGSL
ncbi:hypothetical protein LXL04_038205 [Taraxacum kok-saghyz]